MATTHYDFRFDPRYAKAGRPFGIRPDRASVAIADGEIDARFGPWRLTTPLSNVAAVEVTGPFRFFKTAGAARLGVTDLGLTFASNGDRGVLLTFREKVRGSGPYRLLRHPELTVTVEDVEGFAADVRARLA